MARGNRGEPIGFDEEDRRSFVRTFGETARKTGRQVFAWVSMDNHSHAVFRAPDAKLVEGMKWFPSAGTRRLDARRCPWRHLFGGG